MNQSSAKVFMMIVFAAIIFLIAYALFNNNAIHKVNRSTLFGTTDQGPEPEPEPYPEDQNTNPDAVGQSSNRPTYHPSSHSSSGTPADDSPPQESDDPPQQDPEDPVQQDPQDPVQEEPREEPSGDLNCDGVINDKDIKVVEAYYNSAYTPLLTSPDFNNDGIVDLSDLAALLAMYGSYDGACPVDLIGDQIVDDRDIKILEAFYGQPYTGIRNPDLNLDGIVDLSDLAAELALLSI